MEKIEALRRCGRLLGCVEEGLDLGGYQNPPGLLSDMCVEGQPRLDETVALSCVRKSSGGGGGNSPLVTRQAATGDI